MFTYNVLIIHEYISKICGILAILNTLTILFLFGENISDFRHRHKQAAEFYNYFVAYFSQFKIYNIFVDLAF